MIWGASALIALLSTAQAAPRPYLIQEYKDFADGRTTAEALLNVRDQMVAPGEMLLRKIISNVDTARGLYQGNDMRHNTQTRKLKVRTSGFAYLDTFSDATCSARTIQSGMLSVSVSLSMYIYNYIYIALTHRYIYCRSSTGKVSL